MAWMLSWSQNVEGCWELIHQWLSTRPPPHRPCPALPCPPLLCPAVLCHALPCCAMLRPAVPCWALLCPALLCCALACCAMLCPALPCPALPCLALPCPAVSCCALPCCVLLKPAVPCCAVSCCALPCPAVLHCTCPGQRCAVLSYFCCVLYCVVPCLAWLLTCGAHSSSMSKQALSVCRGLRPLANAQGQNSVSSDLRCMALAGWCQGTGQEGASQEDPLQAHIVTASSDATMSLLHFDVHACRSACELTHVDTHVVDTCISILWGFCFVHIYATASPHLPFAQLLASAGTVSSLVAQQM